MPKLTEVIGIAGRFVGTFLARVGLVEQVGIGRARINVKHIRNGVVLSEDEAENLITDAGRDFLHQQGYKDTGLGSNGLNYIGLSNDALTETSSSTTLSNEIAANGLSRAQGAYAHTTGTNTTTISKTFTCATAQQSARKAALFTASSSGTMNHVLAFTQRTLEIGDQVQITFTITLG